MGVRSKNPDTLGLHMSPRVEDVCQESDPPDRDGVGARRNRQFGKIAVSTHIQDGG
jgi:hypothetical protein